MLSTPTAQSRKERKENKKERIIRYMLVILKAKLQKTFQIGYHNINNLLLKYPLTTTK